MKDGKNIDDLFKDGLANPDIPFNEADWESLVGLLPSNKKRKVIPMLWYAIFTGIAATLIIVFLLNSNDETTKSEMITKFKIKKTNEIKTAEHSNKNKKELIRVYSNIATYDKKEILNNPIKHHKLIDVDLNNTVDTNNLNIVATVLLHENKAVNINVIANQRTESNDDVLINSTDEKAKPKLLKSKPRLTLSILVAPDLTSVQSSGKSKLNGGLGIEATLFLTKRLSITSGATYTKKVYDTDFSFYKPVTTYVFPERPINIKAVCDVIDIPLNLNYQIFSRNRNSVTLSSGLSSYLMLSENYAFSYYNTVITNPQSYRIKNQNKHYFGVANLGVEFKHQVNNKLSIGLRPYVKLPITNMGYGNVKLSSAGMAISVNMNLLKRGEN